MSTLEVKTGQVHQLLDKTAAALGVTGRRVTVLVDALVDDRLVARYAHPTDGRSTIIVITEAGLAQQRKGMATTSAHYLRRIRRPSPLRE
ncbi:hypothetical protein [Nocardia miyunensis]|uniref:hypothetical protein n=1 Tax=Nocardia miyunensis TaxID=282684 RepID=UPI000834B713|nr:hypothetical protein [Nocardia miyunensis]